MNRRGEDEDEVTHDPIWIRLLVPFIGYTVTLAWAVSFVVGIVDQKYTPPAGVQALMMVVAGSTFALPILRGRNNK